MFLFSEVVVTISFVIAQLPITSDIQENAKQSTPALQAYINPYVDGFRLSKKMWSILTCPLCGHVAMEQCTPGAVTIPPSGPVTILFPSTPVLDHSGTFSGKDITGTKGSSEGFRVKTGPRRLLFEEASEGSGLETALLGLLDETGGLGFFTG